MPAATFTATFDRPPRRPQLAFTGHLRDTGRPAGPGDPTNQRFDRVLRAGRRHQPSRRGKNLPSKRVVTALTKDLLRLLFPGFFDDKLIHSSEIKVETAARLDAILGPLEDEIRKSLEYHPPPEYVTSKLSSAAPCCCG